MEVPQEYISFLRDNSATALPMADSEFGGIELIPPEKLLAELIPVVSDFTPHNDLDPYSYLDGSYLVTMVILVSSCDNYDPEGVLAWFPRYRSFGSYDSEHETVYTFPKVSWKQLSRRPARYLDQVFDPPDSVYPLPWLGNPYVFEVGNDCGIIKPYPRVCRVHGRSLKVGRSKRFTLVDRGTIGSLIRRHVRSYVETSASGFPYPGLPVSPSKAIRCKDCEEKERDWVSGMLDSQHAIRVRMYRPDWAKCPQCCICFSVSNPRSFRHRVHVSCGTMLHILPWDEGFDV
jgi:hypothetical protein